MPASMIRLASAPKLFIGILSLILLVSCGGNGVTPSGPADQTYAHTGTLVSVLKVSPQFHTMSLQMKIKVKSLSLSLAAHLSTRLTPSMSSRSSRNTPTSPPCLTVVPWSPLARTRK